MNFSRRCTLFSFLCLALCTAAIAQTENWITTWTAAPLAVVPGHQAYVTLADGTSLTEIVHLSAGGTQIRVRFSNTFGATPLTIDHATIAIHGGKQPVPLTFAGQASVKIPAGAPYVSDSVALAVPPLADVEVEFRVPQFTGTQSTHQLASATAYITEAGERQPIHVWPFLNAVEVAAPAGAFTVVCLGDSITDGADSTGDTNRRYPDELARRLQANDKTAKIAVANAGISGNRLLNEVDGPNALSRFDRDVLAQSGVRYLIVLEGINDILRSVRGLPGAKITVAEITAAYRQIINRAHAHGIRVIGATLTPTDFEQPESQTMIDAVNEFIRTSGAFDAVVDFNAAVRDPAHPQHFLPAYDSGDHLHPGDAGYKAMANAIDLALFAK